MHGVKTANLGNNNLMHPHTFLVHESGEYKNGDKNLAKHSLYRNNVFNLHLRPKKLLTKKK